MRAAEERQGRGTKGRRVETGKELNETEFWKAEFHHPHHFPEGEEVGGLVY